jgi:hypothetical protein
MPFWSNVIGDGDASKLFDMRTNLRYGCSILRHYLDLEGGDLFLALRGESAVALTMPWRWCVAIVWWLARQPLPQPGCAPGCVAGRPKSVVLTC